MNKRILDQPWFGCTRQSSLTHQRLGYHATNHEQAFLAFVLLLCQTLRAKALRRESYLEPSSCRPCQERWNPANLRLFIVCTAASIQMGQIVFVMWTSWHVFASRTNQRQRRSWRACSKLFSAIWGENDHAFSPLRINTTWSTDFSRQAIHRSQNGIPGTINAALVTKHPTKTRDLVKTQTWKRVQCVCLPGKL